MNALRETLHTQGVLSDEEFAAWHGLTPADRVLSSLPK